MNGQILQKKNELKLLKEQSCQLDLQVEHDIQVKCATKKQLDPVSVLVASLQRVTLVLNQLILTLYFKGLDF